MIAATTAIVIITWWIMTICSAFLSQKSYHRMWMWSCSRIRILTLQYKEGFHLKATMSIWRKRATLLVRPSSQATKRCSTTWMRDSMAKLMRCNEMALTIWLSDCKGLTRKTLVWISTLCKSFLVAHHTNCWWNSLRPTCKKWLPSKSSSTDWIEWNGKKCWLLLSYRLWNRCSPHREC